MNYDIKITGDETDNGLLEFDRLIQITQITKEIATKALMLRLRGFSDIKPDENILDALAIRLQQLSGDKQNGTIMVLDCDRFETHMIEREVNSFGPPEDLLQLTPMALVIQSFRAALMNDEDKNNLDKPLLRSLLKFKKNFINNNEAFYFSNRQSLPEIVVTRDDFEKIEYIEDTTPLPTRIIINGRLDEMKGDKSKLWLLTQDGLVNVFADPVLIEGAKDFMGKEVTITGKAYFKPGGLLSYVDVQGYHEPGGNDKCFSRKPMSMSAEQQILYQLKQGKKRDWLHDILGQWPGDETDEEFEQIMKELD